MEELVSKDNFDQLTRDVDQARFDLSIELGREPMLHEITKRLESLGLIPEINSEPELQPTVSKKVSKWSPTVDEDIFSLRDLFETIVECGIDEMAAVARLKRKGWDVSTLENEIKIKNEELEYVN